jgi:hypothetical protein
MNYLIWFAIYCERFFAHNPLRGALAHIYEVLYTKYYIRSTIYEVLYTKYYIRSTIYEVLYTKYYLRTTMYHV